MIFVGKMDILFISHNFFPESNAPAVRTYEHLSYWQSLGHNVTVVSSVPNFPDGKVYAGFKNRFFGAQFDSAYNHLLFPPPVVLQLFEFFFRMVALLLYKVSLFTVAFSFSISSSHSSGLRYPQRRWFRTCTSRISAAI